jgi:hypothetical protein
MPDHERELVERANAEQDKLLQQIEEGLEHSREIIRQINKVTAGDFRFLTFSNVRRSKPLGPRVSLPALSGF